MNLATEIIVRPTTGPSTREYHVRGRVSEVPFASFLKPLYGTESDYLPKLGKYGQQIIGQLLKTNGIEEIFLRPFSIEVIKSASVDWSQLEPRIMRTLEQVLGKLEVGHRMPVLTSKTPVAV